MSGNTIDTLIIMANQIGDFFESMKDRTKSLDEIAGHLRRSWDPRMRIALMDHVEHHGGEGLKDIVLEAVRTHKMI
ncbi:MAG TPA: formate dehydrogenase subunit delta [Oxalicibacterium sp.]|uniref:formate dehydrogenase subunit delta n=1 Tax=Oxalicibacterium sp. TaxID=2766525 RepID=UPI002B50BBD6|nr:formate dehydrogenase subunit delta [Oxalicibacterium sp.]HWU99322.1 formate dehydrogenase subunit delta [Oxalicibacterium sp.]